MKRICVLILTMIMLCMPMTALAEEMPSSPEATTDLSNEPSPDPAATVTPDPSVAADPAPTPTPEPTQTAAPTTQPTQPVETPAPIADQLYIDSWHLYEGMDKTYEQGYVPRVVNDKVYIILPLLGQTYDNKVTVTADLGATANSPFVFGNYSQTAGGWGAYVFAFEIPLASDRINGAYPITFNAVYIDVTGALTNQAFIVHVTITDGKDPIDPNAVLTPPKEKAEKPELFISSCVIDPNTVGGDQEFSVKVTIDNIGNIRARSVRLSYGGASTEGGSPGIVPVETTNAVHLENIASEESSEVTFRLKTTPDVISGNQSFFVTLDYVDLYGGVYSSTRNFLIAVTQPAEMRYDDITKSVPEKITAGETFSLPANVYNTGRSALKNVMVTVEGAGLFPTSAVFLGDIAPGSTGNGELSVFAGQLSMTEGYTEDYGKTNGRYTITYTDEAGEEHTIDIDFSLEIVKPVIETDEEETELTEEPAFQWWVTILVGLAIIAIIVALIVVAKFTRASKMR